MSKSLENLRQFIRKTLSESVLDLDPTKYIAQASYHKDMPDFFDPQFNKTFANDAYPPVLGVLRNQSALSEDNKTKTYYNSHGRTMPFSEFIEIEVIERENYSKKEVAGWMKKYGIKLADKCIWITENKHMAHRYNISPDADYESIPEDELDVHEIDSKVGFIISESDDGDEGFLFVYRS